jgi:hypothetical protein
MMKQQTEGRDECGEKEEIYCSRGFIKISAYDEDGSE